MADYVAIIKNQKEDLDDLLKADVLVREPMSNIDLNSPCAQVVIGVRRSGKSILCLTAFKSAGIPFGFVNFDDENLDGIEAAGVLDIYGRRWYHYHGLFVEDYMNSGVMLFNLPECIKTGMFEKAVNLCMSRWMMLADQAALNKAIYRRKLVERKYNEQEERPREDTVLHHFSCPCTTANIEQTPYRPKQRKNGQKNKRSKPR